MTSFARGAGREPAGPAVFLGEVVRPENHGVGVSIPPLGTTQLTPAKKLRGDRCVGLETARRPGAAQGPQEGVW